MLHISRRGSSLGGIGVAVSVSSISGSTPGSAVHVTRGIGTTSSSGSLDISSVNYRSNWNKWPQY